MVLRLCLDITPTPSRGSYKALSPPCGEQWGSASSDFPGPSQVLSLPLGLQRPFPTPRVRPGPDSRGQATWPEETPLWAPSLSAEPPVVLASQCPSPRIPSSFYSHCFVPRGPGSSKSSPKALSPGLELPKDYTLNGPGA